MPVTRMNELMRNGTPPNVCKPFGVAENSLPAEALSESVVCGQSRNRKLSVGTTSVTAALAGAG